MKTLISSKTFLFLLIFKGIILVPLLSTSQTAEWRLVMKSFSSEDPDAAGPAVGSVQFDLEMRATSGTVAAREISIGYTYQSTKAMVPTTPGCATVSNPANITVSPEFAAGGYTFSFVNQCNPAVTNAGGQVFDRTAAGTLEQGGGAGITLTTAWVPALTITLWTLSATNPEGGYALIHSGSTGAPGALSTYAMANSAGDEVTVNSLTYNTPLMLGSSVLPVRLSNFDITCTGNGAKINWKTLTEENSSNFEVEKSMNGATGWTSIGTTSAAGNSSGIKQYEYYDLKGGSAYYRLRQVDKDGRYTYSSVEKVNCITREASILLYPIPAKNTLNVILSTERSSKATVLLVDISGKIMRQISTELQKGTNNLKVNVTGLSSGEYILKVLGSDNFKAQKVTIIR